MTKFYICLDCGDMVTSDEIEESMESGGLGLCYCRYDVREWDVELNCFQPIYYRMLNDYTEISEYLFNELKKETNTILRLGMLKSIPPMIDLTTIGE